MTMVSILPITTDGNGPAFRALLAEKQSTGRTMGEALDALTAQFTGGEVETLVLVGGSQPDPFFNRSQQERLADLIDRWQAARDRGEELAGDAQRELDGLVQAELNASGARAATLADALGR